VFKLVSAFVSGSVLGLLLNRMEAGAENEAPLPAAAKDENCTCGNRHHGDTCRSHVEHDHRPGSGTGVAGSTWSRLLAGVKRVVGYAFGDLLGDFAGALAAGLLLSAAVTVLLPAGILGGFAQQWLYYPAMLAVSMPLYVCAVSSVPLAFALVSQGLPPGAALVLLIAGPATNFATLGVALKTIGRRGTLLYVSGIAVLAISSGLLFDSIVAAGAVPSGFGAASGLIPTDIAIVSAIILPGLVVFHLVRNGLRRLDDRLQRRPGTTAPVSETPSGR